MATEATGTGTSAGKLYVRAMDETMRYVNGVRPDQWEDPTPCTEWNVRAVVNHLVGENLWAGELFPGKTIQEVGNALDGDLTGADPAAAYSRSVNVAKAEVTRPGAMEAICHLSFGDFPGSEYARQLFMDTLVHGWDVAKATGQDTRLNPELVEACLPMAQEMATNWRSSGAFGEDLPVSPDANPQIRLLALLGRVA